MKKYPIILVFLILPITLFSQKIVLQGTVKDSLQTPLSYANVIATPKDTSKNLQFATTDDEGYYKLIFNRNDTLKISITYLGYKPISFDFIANRSETKNFVMKTSSEQLEEIIIEMPVTVKGDTTIYNISKFTTGEERKLKNVLKKLPGVQVDKEGNVMVQGKKVTKMLVDGKKFFGGNSKLAVENIPADAIDKVEVIDNYNEVSFLKNLSDSDDMAMNIQLKNDKKHFVFGDIEGGVGNNEFYRTHTNLFYYSPKTNVNFIGNINNIAEQTFTFKDYLNFQGGINAVFNGNFDFKGGDFTLFLNERDVLASTQKFGALNISKTTSDKLDIAGYIILNKTDDQNFLETFNDYSTFNELRTNDTRSDNFNGIGRFSIEYSINETEQFYARTQVKLFDNATNNLTSSIVGNDLNVISTNRDLLSVYVNQNIEWHKRKSEQHTFSTIINYDYSKNDKTTVWRTMDDILSGLIPVVSNQNELRLLQDRDVKNHSVNGVFKHFWEINNSNHLYTTLGNNFRHENFITKDLQQLDDGNENDFSADGFGNDTDLFLNDLFFGIHYKFRAGVFTLKQGVTLRNYSWRVDQQNITSKNNWFLLPDFLAKIELSKSKKIQINYRMRTSFTEAGRLTNRFYLQSYNSVFRGNSNLENNLFHSASIYYSRFSLYRGLLMNASLNYNKQIKGVRNTVEFNGVNQFITNRLFDDPSENIDGRVSIQKKIKKIRYKFEGSISLSNFLQEVDNIIQNNSNNNYSYSVGLETLFDNFPNIELGFKRSTGKFTASNNTSEFRTNEPYFSLNYDFLEAFIFSFDYTSYDFKNEALNQKNTFDVANFTLSYRKENSPWEYKILSNNLFNAGFKRNSSFSQYLISDTKTFILPRVLMFSIGYNL